MKNPKAIIEFFEKECYVRFVDVKTGKSVLDILNENQSLKNRQCASCKHALKAGGNFVLIGEIICGNKQAEFSGKFKGFDDICERWDAVIR